MARVERGEMVGETTAEETGLVETAQVEVAKSELVTAVEATDAEVGMEVDAVEVGESATVETTAARN